MAVNLDDLKFENSATSNDDSVSNKEDKINNITRQTAGGEPRGKSFTQKDQSTGNELHLREVCGKELPVLTKLKSRIHSEDTQFYYEEYRGRFTNSTNLKNHMQTTIGGKYACEVCGKKFIVLSNLKRHSKTHVEDKQLDCEECGKLFAHPCHFKRHMRSHTGERPFTCDQCGKQFGHLSHLNSHMRMHTGEQSYQCEECLKSFFRPQNLRQHMRTHTGERPYNCEECGKTFAQSSNLKAHSKIHTGEKSYVCQQCEKRFPELSRLKKHMTTHTSK